MRVGIGYDIHKLVEGKPLILGGVEIPWTKGAVSFSDGDALLHAISDAILGAAGLRDIGTHFPDTNPKYKGISSAKILAEAASLIKKEGFCVNNIDCVVILEEPKINRYVESIKKRIAEILNIEAQAVGIKATTNEHLGSIGRSAAIACQAVATLKGGKT